MLRVLKNILKFNSLPHGKFFMLFVVCWFFSKSTFLKNSSRNTIWVSNRLDPDQARHFVRTDLGPNCLQRLSADDTRRQRVKQMNQKIITIFLLKLFANHYLRQKLPVSKATNIFMDSSNLCRQNKFTAYKVLMWLILLDLSFSGSDVIFCGIEQNNEVVRFLFGLIL